jgi:hypothetical protein
VYGACLALCSKLSSRHGHVDQLQIGFPALDTQLDLVLSIHLLWNCIFVWRLRPEQWLIISASKADY